jgi:hypothetical protein
MKYLVERNGVKFIEDATRAPADNIGEWTYGISEDPRWIIATDGVLSIDFVEKAAVQAADALAAVETAKAVAIYNEYVTLNTVVLADVKAKLFAESPESATANYLELIMMRDSPASFSGQGLLAEVDVKQSDLITKIIDKGEPLDTDQKCLDYATRLIEISIEYAIYRHKKKDEFRAYKASL